MGLAVLQSREYQSIVPALPPQHMAEASEQTGLCGPSRGYTIRRWMGVRRSTWLLSIYIVAYLMYLFGGCMIFTTLEQGAEEKLKWEIASQKAKFLARHRGVQEQELEHLIESILFRGISPLQRDLNSSNWKFGQSFLFAVTVVTTVGYGHIHPMTPDGKIACMLYAVVGIPFTLIFLSAVVQRLLSPTFSLLSALTARLPQMDSLQVRLLHLATMGSLFFLLAVILPSVAFYLLEPGWSMLDATYFVFISITTIGLGDYIPGDAMTHTEFRNTYKTGVGLGLLFGLLLTTLTLTVFYDIPQLNLGLHLLRHKDIAADKPKRPKDEDRLSISAAGFTTTSAISSRGSSPARSPPRMEEQENH